MRTREDGSGFVPNNLLMVKKTDPQKAIKNLARELRRAPNIGDLETRH
jgi:hypothetical protein